MPNTRLTDVAIKSLKPPHGGNTYWDETHPAFGVRVIAAARNVCPRLR